MTESDNPTQISADEVALYDRQIRLWGMDGQNRMRNSKVLLINLGALASEVAKNIVLAGIGSLTILDSHIVTDNDLGANFFLRDDDVGKNRANAGLARVRELNKRVEVSVVDKTLEDVEAEWISGFDIIVATQLPYDQLVHVNEQARADNKYFYAAGLMGMYGYTFADLVEHGFKIERNKPNKATVLGPENGHCTVVSAEVRKDGEQYIETVTKTEKYKPLKDAVNHACQDGQFGTHFKGRKLMKISPLLPALLALWDGELTKDTAVAKAQSMGLPTGIVNDNLINSLKVSGEAELSPVAAVIGGILAQDMLNVLVQKGQPIQNLLLFDGNTNEGPIYTL